MDYLHALIKYLHSSECINSESHYSITNNKAQQLLNIYIDREFITNDELSTIIFNGTNNKYRIYELRNKLKNILLCILIIEAPQIKDNLEIEQKYFECLQLYTTIIILKLLNKNKLSSKLSYKCLRIATKYELNEIALLVTREICSNNINSKNIDLYRGKINLYYKLIQQELYADEMFYNVASTLIQRKFVDKSESSKWNNYIDFIEKKLKINIH